MFASLAFLLLFWFEWCSSDVWVGMCRSQHLAPAAVILYTVDGQGDHFDVAFAELGAQLGSSAQLCGAHRGVISWVGEQDSPSRQKREEVSLVGLYRFFWGQTSLKFPVIAF